MPAAADWAITDFQLEEAAPGLGRDARPPVRQMRACFSVRLPRFPASGRFECYAQVFACNLTTGQATMLAAGREVLGAAPEREGFSLTFPLPEVGRYQVVGVVVNLEGQSASAVLGPVINVLP